MSTITTQEVSAAAAELGRMRQSLTSWLRFRTLNDQVLSGAARVRKPLPYAQRVIAGTRDMAVEQDLATQLHALLGVLMKGQPLPDPDVTTNRNAAVALAQLALQGGTSLTSPRA